MMKTMLTDIIPCSGHLPGQNRHRHLLDCCGKDYRYNDVCSKEMARTPCWGYLLVVLGLWCVNTGASISLKDKDDGNIATSPSKWCSYIHNSPEPELIIFNRFMKCGSSTMNSIISRLQNKHSRFYFHSQNGVDWQKNSPEKLHQSFTQILQNSNTSRMVIEGHFNWKDFGLLNSNLEYIQLLRNCPDRHTSNFFYRLPNHGKDLKPKLAACLLEEQCVNSFPDLQYMGTSDYSETFCDWRCSTTEEVLERLHPPGRGQFSIVGLLEYFSEYLEMLQCIYPTVFEDVFSLPNLSQMRENISGGSNRTQSHVVRHVMAKKCEGSSDESVYLAMKEIFFQRYEYMKQHPSQCCRRFGKGGSRR